VTNASVDVTEGYPAGKIRLERHVAAAIFHNDETTQLNTYSLAGQPVISAAHNNMGKLGQPIVFSSRSY
jgi:hypothetical protein